MFNNMFSQTTNISLKKSVKFVCVCYLNREKKNAI